MLALNIASSGFSCLFSMSTFAAKIGPEIGVPWDCFCANHKYKALSNCLFCISFIVFRLFDKSMLSTLVLYSLSFDSFSFISDIIDFPTSYFFASDVIVLDISPFCKSIVCLQSTRQSIFTYLGFSLYSHCSWTQPFFADRLSRDGLRGGLDN